MKKWFVGLALLLAAGLVALLLNRRPVAEPVGASSEAAAAAMQAALKEANPAVVAAIDSSFAPARSAGEAAVQQTVVPVPPTPPTAPLFTNLPPATVMENVRRAIRDYGSRFGGNPVGTNPEIARALGGENPRQVNFLDAESGVRVNGQGELVDAWGVPLFFHQLSGREMEIHSAGPDRILWTTDDLVIK